MPSLFLAHKYSHKHCLLEEEIQFTGFPCLYGKHTKKSLPMMPMMPTLFSATSSLMNLMAHGVNPTLDSVSLIKPLLKGYKTSGRGKNTTSCSTMATHSFVPMTTQVCISNNVYHLSDFYRTYLFLVISYFRVLILHSQEN